MLLHVPGGTRPEAVNEAMKQAIAALPGEVFLTLLGSGKRTVRHAMFTADTGIQVYFCDPHSPWQRGSNKNTNGLLSQYMPKAADLSVHDADDLARFAGSLNNRPRETLGFMKPSEKLADRLALTG
jgi:IS30 family transposase